MKNPFLSKGAAERGVFGLEKDPYPYSRKLKLKKPPGRGAPTHPLKSRTYACGFGHKTDTYNGGKCSHPVGEGECGAACWLMMSSFPRKKRRRKKVGSKGSGT